MPQEVDNVDGRWCIKSEANELTTFNGLLLSRYDEYAVCRWIFNAYWHCAGVLTLDSWCWLKNIKNKELWIIVLNLHGKLSGTMCGDFTSCGCWTLLLDWYNFRDYYSTHSILKDPTPKNGHKLFFFFFVFLGTLLSYQFRSILQI